jgi:Ca-activated chloride channel family protein
LRQAVLISWVLLSAFTAEAQFYMRGEVRDEKQQPLQNVSILLHSTGVIYNSGLGGAFGISTALSQDSLSFKLDGYEPVRMAVNASNYLEVTMKMMPFTASLQRFSLLSMTREQQQKASRFRMLGDESYHSLVENEFIRTEKDPDISVVLNVDRASYSNIRRFIRMGNEVPPDAVRIEEMLNYFSLDPKPPGADSLFRLRTRMSTCPWNDRNRLLYVHVNARKVDMDKVPPGNLVFLIDASGSMDLPNRLPLLKTAFRRLVENLRPIDTVSIVVYGDAPGTLLRPTSGAYRDSIIKVINDLEAGGSTPGEAGIMQAYALAKKSFIKGGNNRIILATDGDFNVGRHSEEELEQIILQQRQGGIYLTCLGVGMGNYKDSKIEILAKKGNGNFAYIDTEQEAEKVLVKELTQTLYTVADDVYMQVRFNPAAVSEHRLIGFDNKVAALSDSSKALEGGEVGSGHSTMAIFEIVPTEAKAGEWTTTGTRAPEIAAVTLNYKMPGKPLPFRSEYRTGGNVVTFDKLERPYQFAATVALYGCLLRNSPHVGVFSWEDMMLMAGQYHDPADPLQAEFNGLVQATGRIYGAGRKKKRTGAK